MARRGSNRRNGSNNISSPSTNSPPTPAPVLKSIDKPAPPVPGLFDAPSLDAQGKPSMAIADFEGFGWSPEKIKAVLEIPELPVDSLTQVAPSVTFEDRVKQKKAKYRHARKTGLIKPPEGYEAEEDSNGNKTNRVRRKKRRNEHLFIGGSNNWVLFDPLQGYGQRDEPTPELFTKFERYKPGNKKILCFNLESRAMKLKTTPAEFEGYEVEYLPTGAALVLAKALRAQPVRKTREAKGKEVESPQESEKKGEKEKTPPPTRRSPRSRKRSRDAEEEAEVVEVESAPAPKRRRAVPKSKK